MDISAEVAAIQAASQGSELRQPIVSALNKLNSGSLPAVTASDAGKILKVGANGWEVGEKSGYMPVPTATKQITENGTHDVTNYASAVVNVSGGGGILIPKTITQNGTYNPANDNADGYSEVTVNVSGGGGNSLFWSGGKYFGNPQGGLISTINIVLSGTIGNTAIIVIMHRSALTVPNDLIFVDNKKNPMTSATGNLPQEISIYKKVLTSTSESYTISQSSSVRMCACCYYFSSDPNINYLKDQEMDTGVSHYSYTISNAGKPTFVIISNSYSGSDQNIINTMTPEQLCVTPEDNLKWFNSSTGASVGFRMFAIINNSPNNLIITANTNWSQDDQDINRAYIYTIG